MRVNKLELVNFRNYNSLEIDFDSNINILYGMNAQGKTNILESIYMCSTTKSHRTNKDIEMINFNEDEAHIKLNITKADKEFRIDIHLKKNKKKGIAINRIPIKRADELFGIFNVIFFSPEDLNIIKNGPKERRKFIDIELCQLDKIYVYNLVNYNKVLNQRNQVLKDVFFEPSLKETLDIWDMQLAKYGKEIIRRREEFIEKINEIILPIHSDITDNLETIKIEYDKNVDEDDFYEMLVRKRNDDISRKTTTIGPHRDDIIIYSNDINVRTYGSQGQKRTAALSLKLAEIELVKKQIGENPILLLDDVLSELDSSRQNHLLKTIKDIQTIITCTGLDDFIENRFKIDKVFEVDNGKVEVKTV